MSRKLIVFAQLAEAAATLHALKADSTESPNYYTFEHGLVVVSGMGVHAAGAAVFAHAHQADEVWNLGIAGALQDTLPIGEILTIETVGKYAPSGPLDPLSQEIVATTLPHFTLKCGKGKLISSDFPIYDKSHRSHLGKKWEVVDMEGYGIAYAANYLGKKCRMWKIVSDFASPGGREELRKNKAHLSERIAEKIYESCSHP